MESKDHTHSHTHIHPHVHAHTHTHTRKMLQRVFGHDTPNKSVTNENVLRKDGDRDVNVWEIDIISKTFDVAFDRKDPFTLGDRFLVLGK